MKIQLRSLRVKSCGPLDDVLIDFCDKAGNPQPVTVLAGANGSGKTTILKLIVELAQLLSDNDMPGDVGTTLLKCAYAQLGLLIDETPASVAYGKKPNDVAVIHGLYMSSAAREGHQPRDYENNEALNSFIDMLRLLLEIPLDSPDNQLPFDRHIFIIPSILFFPSNRVVLPVQGQYVQREATNYEWVYKYQAPGKFAKSLDSYLIWLDYAEPEVYVQVIDFLDSLDFEGKKFGVQRKELRAIVTTKGGHTHGVAELSSGEQNILIMLLELRRRLLPHSIVLIDEIENSLHPAFQYKLAKSLKRMQEQIPFQLIVTTHAPAFLEVFGEQSARILTEF